MSSSCLSGGGRAYRLDLELIKSATTTFSISNSSSPSSSTLSESSNSPLSIFTKKPRTPRKRPNQTYNEAAAILSTAHPKIFPTKHLTKPFKFTKSHETSFLSEPSELLIMPLQSTNNSGYLLQYPPIAETPNFNFPIESKLNPCQSPDEVNSQGNNYSEICDEYQDNFDAESILDEEIEEGIDSIMGNPSTENKNESINSTQMSNCCYGYPVGLGFDYGYGMRTKLRRNVDEGDWWRFPTVNVNVVDVTQKISKINPVEKKKKKNNHSDCGKKNSFATSNAKTSKVNAGGAACADEPNAGLLLKLNYDQVLKAWSDKGTPFAGDAPPGNDVQARLREIDLFSDNALTRGAIVLRYKDKRRTRLFSKKIRYQVRKVNADQRPRLKGRFVRTPNSPDDN